ncbi:MAG: hypothetical protein EPN26_16840 [Rhodospirillales bacterium]|nr:MAG: hypothetical protein EPN26_16840 [Rhodospirillales bacterium]
MLINSFPDQPNGTLRRRQGFGQRMAAWLGLSLLLLNLVVGALLPQTGLDNVLDLEICSAHEVLTQEDGSPAGLPQGQNSQNSPHCLFCLPLSQSIIVPKSPAQPLRHALTAATIFDRPASFSPASHPATRAAPRAPPFYS